MKRQQIVIYLVLLIAFDFSCFTSESAEINPQQIKDVQPLKSASTLVVKIDNNNYLWAMSYEMFISQANNNYRSRGSGFLVKYPNKVFLVSAGHCLKKATPTLKSQFFLNKAADVAIAPWTLVNTFKDDYFNYNQLSQLTNDNLEDLPVTIKGYGSDKLIYLDGKANLIKKPFITGGESRYENMFRVKVKLSNDINLNNFTDDLSGLSGSPVLDKTTNLVIGMLHTAAIYTLRGEAFPAIIFSGPDELRTTLKKADYK